MVAVCLWGWRAWDGFGLAVIMLLAVLTHIRRREPSGVVFTAALMLAAVVVAWDRFGQY